MNKEEELELSLQAKVDFIGEELTQEVYRGVRLTRVMENIFERLEKLEGRYSTGNKGVLYEMKNELTHLHNEIRDVQKLLGIDGSEPKLGGKKYEWG